MTTSNRIRGNTGIVLTLKKGATAATSYSDDAKEVVISGTDKDDNDITFADVTAGALQDATIKIKAIQSTDATSLHQFLFDNQGVEVELVYGPHGNATPTATQPHFKVTKLKIENIPDIGGPARKSTEGYDFDYELKSSGTLTKVTS